MVCHSDQAEGLRIADKWVRTNCCDRDKTAPEPQDSGAALKKPEET